MAHAPHHAGHAPGSVTPGAGYADPAWTGADGAGGAGAAVLTAATNDEAPELAGGGGFQGARNEVDAAHSAHAGADRKAWATVQARCALAGFRADLIDGDDGRPLLVVSRWALTRSFEAPSDALAWLQRVTGVGC